MSRTCLCGTLLAVAALGVVQPAQATMMTFNAAQDATITDRPTTGRNTPDNGTTLIVREGGTTDRKEALFQFDLSSIAGPGFVIVGAYYQLYDTGTDAAQGADFVNDAYLVHPDAGATPAELTYLNSGGSVALDLAGIHADNVTYNAYAAAVGGFWTEAGASSINLSLAAGNAGDQYYDSNSADPATLALMNAIKDNYGQLIVLNWRGAGSRTFASSEGGHAPVLVLDVNVVPEPSTMLLLAAGAVGVGLFRLKR